MTCQWAGLEGGHEEPVLSSSQFVSHNFVSGSSEEGLTGNGMASLESREDPSGLPGSCCNSSGET